MKITLKHLLRLYHPDKNNNTEDGWSEFAREVTVLINHYYKIFK